MQAKVGRKDREARQARAQAADAEHRARRDRIGRWIAVGAAVVMSGFAVVYSNSNAQDVAELSTSGQVASARATSLDALRGAAGRPCDPGRPTLFCANRALVDAGLPPVPDPGPTALAYDVSAAIGRALGRLDTLTDLRARGAVLPGVRLPDASGRFPTRPGR